MKVKQNLQMNCHHKVLFSLWKFHDFSKKMKNCEKGNKKLKNKKLKKQTKIIKSK